MKDMTPEIGFIALHTKSIKGGEGRREEVRQGQRVVEVG